MSRHHAPTCAYNNKFHLVLFQDMIPRILIENIVNDLPIRKFGAGEATRTWIYISDIVSAFITALLHPCDGFAEFNTGAPNSTTLNEMIACAEKVTGKKAIIEQCEVPPGDAHTGEWVGGSFVLAVFLCPNH